MKYNLSKEFDCQKATKRLEKLIKDGLTIEITLHKEKRSLPQNGYLHACIAVLADDIGNTIEEMKEVLKRELGYVYKKNGYEFLIKTSLMDTAEMAIFTEKVRNWASINGYYLHSPEEYKSGEMDAYIGRNKLYL